MKTTKLFTVIANPQITKFCITRNSHSEAVETLAKKRLDHYRSLNALIDSDLKPPDWDNAKPFESIPGPEPLPVVGNAWRFLLPKIGDFYGLDFLHVLKSIYKKHGDIAILKGLVGAPDMVLLFNPQDIEKMHRNEGVWPIRKGLQSFQYYRETRKDILKSRGLVTLQGEEWFKFRTVVNPLLMQPKNVVQYTVKINQVAQEFIDNIKFLSEQNEQGQMPDDFINEIYKYTLESIGVVTMDTRLGCLSRAAEKDSEPQKLIHSVIRMFELMYKLDVLPSLWKYVNTSSWREYVRVLDFLLETNLKYIDQQLEKIDKGEVDETDGTSVLYKMLKVDKTIALAMAVDMMIAGVDTTGRVLGAALYYLSKHPEKQQILRDEAFSLLRDKDSPVTKEILSNATYTKSVLKETTRLSPIAVGNMRTLSKNLVLGGYQIPAETNVMSATLLLCHQNENFSKAEEFLPERWLSSTFGELSHKNSHPFVFAPFGTGARSCVGKRIANLELETALLKIARNFELKWPHEDMVFSTTLLHGVARPLKVHVKPLEK